MKCPNCNKDMETIVEQEWSQLDYDEAGYYISEYRCKNCNIQYDALRREYTLPGNLEPTEKQKRTLYFILNRLPRITDELPITRPQYFKFIGKYFDEAKLVKYHNDDFDDDDVWYGFDVPINM